MVKEKKIRVIRAEANKSTKLFKERKYKREALSESWTENKPASSKASSSLSIHTEAQRNRTM